MNSKSGPIDPHYEKIFEYASALDKDDLHLRRFMVFSWFLVQDLDTRVQESPERQYDKGRAFIPLTHIIRLTREIGDEDLREQILETAHITEDEKTILDNTEHQWATLKLPNSDPNNNTQDVTVKDLLEWPRVVYEPLRAGVEPRYRCANCKDPNPSGRKMRLGELVWLAKCQLHYTCVDCQEDCKICNPTPDDEWPTDATDGDDDSSDDFDKDADEEPKGIRTITSQETQEGTHVGDIGNPGATKGTKEDQISANPPNDKTPIDRTKTESEDSTGVDNVLEPDEEKDSLDSKSDIQEAAMSKHEKIMRQRSLDMQAECQPTFYDLSKAAIEAIDFHDGELKPSELPVQYVEVKVGGRVHKVEFKQYMMRYKQLPSERSG
ncbi:hypothetical protein BU23DRAFT_569153 [Bimuria novae-zelandiae CBS 107.79]|uniref:Uncharacterized protein n=1 Tax=Bimuria novae-zelandiae CBS 107.79 TaxID=1447943 RepID=A0A6A5V8J6_9PLEO|nr:hypothetical protein BU23DRAFT_569153 [Bimuria novae-zelandiae CBS 107.79]